MKRVSKSVGRTSSTIVLDFYFSDSIRRRKIIGRKGISVVPLRKSKICTSSLSILIEFEGVVSPLRLIADQHNMLSLYLIVILQNTTIVLQSILRWAFSNTVTCNKPFAKFLELNQWLLTWHTRHLAKARSITSLHQPMDLCTDQ